MHVEQINLHLDVTLNHIHCATLMTQSPDNNSYTYNTMLQHDDRDEFIKATMKEIVDHEKGKHWYIMLREDPP